MAMTRDQAAVTIGDLTTGLDLETTVRGRKFEGDRVWVFSCPLCRAEHDTDIVILGDEVK